MMSVSKSMTSGAAGSYFSQEDYYMRGGETSQWIGKGAETLGLSGQVQKDVNRR